MVEQETEGLLGHIGLDDYRAEDGVSLIFSMDKFEDVVFKGMFVVVEEKNEKFLGQILDEPKSIPVTGRTDNPLNEYPILHQETVQYVPEYKVVSQVRILGQLEGDRILSNFARPKPASKVYSASKEIIGKLFHVEKGEILGRLIGYFDPWIPVSFDDSVARKQLGIFGTTGSGKSNTTLRIAEMYAKRDWCVFILDYLGEYIDCKKPNSENHLFDDIRWKELGITPAGYPNVEVFAPKRDRESKCDTRFFLRTMDVTNEVLYNLIAQEEAQNRKLRLILQKMKKEKIPNHLYLIQLACSYSGKNAKGSLKSSYFVMAERIKSLRVKSIWDQYKPSEFYIDKVKETFDLVESETAEDAEDIEIIEKFEDSIDFISEEEPSGVASDITSLSGISPEKKRTEMGEKDRLNIGKLLEEGKINVFNFKNSTEDDYRSTTLFILSELFRLKKERAEKVKDLPKVLILIEEAHIPFSIETENYLANILMETAKKVFKIGRHYYLNICVITQRPMDCHLALLSQINTRIIHKLKTADDINRVVVGDIEEFKSSIPRLSVGEAMIDCAEWITPLYIKVAPSKSKKIDITYE